MLGYCSPACPDSIIVTLPATYFHSPNTKGPCAPYKIPMSSRGEVRFSPESIGHTSTESIGGRPELAAQVSVGSTFANRQRVPYQSAMEMVPSNLVPRTCLGRYPPEAPC